MAHDTATGFDQVCPPHQEKATKPTAAALQHLQLSVAALQQIFTSNVPIPPTQDLGGDLEKKWKNWLQTWTAYETNTGLRSKPNDYRATTLITCIRPGALEIHSGLSFTYEEDKDRIDRVLGVV